MVNGVVWVFVGFVVFVIIVSYFDVVKYWFYFWYVLFKGLYFVEMGISFVFYKFD